MLEKANKTDIMGSQLSKYNHSIFVRFCPKNKNLKFLYKIRLKLSFLSQVKRDKKMSVFNEKTIQPCYLLWPCWGWLLIFFSFFFFQNVYSNHGLQRISYATCDPISNLLAFLAREAHAPLHLQHCHVFRTSSPDQAEDLNMLIGK